MIQLLGESEGCSEVMKFHPYFRRKETRTAVKVKVLDILSAVSMSFRFWYEVRLKIFISLFSKSHA